jgi:hypothetical protein
MRSGSPGPAPTSTTRPRLIPRLRPQRLEQRPGAGGEQRLGHPAAERLGLGALVLGAHDARAVGARHQAAQAQAPARPRLGEAGQRHVAVALERGQQRALGGQRAGALRVGERGEIRGQRAAGAGLERQHALPHRRQQPLRRDALVHVRGEREPVEAGAGEDHRVEAPSARRSRRVVTLPRSGSTSRSARQARSCAARRALPVPIRAPAGSASSVAKRPPGERVARIGALREGHQREALRHARRQVLRAVHRQVRAPVEQRLLELLHEEPLAAHLRERHVLESVAGGAQRDQLRRDAEPLLDPPRHPLGLGERELARPRGDAQRLHSAPGSRSGGASGPGSVSSASAPGAAGSSSAKSTCAA